MLHVYGAVRDNGQRRSFTWDGFAGINAIGSLGAATHSDMSDELTHLCNDMGQRLAHDSPVSQQPIALYILTH